MFKTFIILIITLLSIGLIGFLPVSAGEASLENDTPDAGNKYSDFNYAILFLKSMSVLSANTIPQLYPDTFYVGPGYHLTHHDPLLDAKKETHTDTVLIDLKWQLDRNWFLGIYSELDRKNETHGNNSHHQIRDTMDKDIGIVFIHKF